MDDLRNMTAAQILEQQKKNCIFCKIISREIPSTGIYSDDKVSVILDINPANEGHCLILPKEHYQILPQIPDKMIGYLFLVAKRTSKLLLQSIGVKSTSVFVANGALAGQKAPHFMIHVIPRRTGDMLFHLPKTQHDPAALNEIKIRLASSLQPARPAKQEHKIGPQSGATGPDAKDEQQKEMNIDDIARLFG